MCCCDAFGGQHPTPGSASKRRYRRCLIMLASSVVNNQLMSTGGCGRPVSLIALCGG